MPALHSPPHLVSVAELVAAHPVAVRVLQRHHIRCHTGWPVRPVRRIEDVCATAGVTVDTLLEEVAIEELASGPEWDWARASLATIIGVIVERWHRSFEEELPRVQALVDELARRHPRPPLPELAEAVAALRADLGPHLLFEECVVFPMILDAQGPFGLTQVLDLDAEHAFAVELLDRIRALTNDYRVPGEADFVQRKLWAALATLERDLDEHLAVEIDVLFARAIAGEDPYLGAGHPSAARLGFVAPGSASGL